ncbi:hypothetical protein BSK54_10355 [Paenibacillus odorifer]|uniref:hypothetical protein n=1 Tax=Paenibacillus odorifer TaxID=189426 RepID=UPI00096CE0A6|nr:hypothetical protein [Paenibacillus odorifer]OME02651.1 hypothetical protein BSK54_10355 [Paenibacillus odorifer]
MEQRKSMIEMQWQITEGGKVVPFEEYLRGSVMDGISDHVFYDDLLATLEAGTDPDTQWTDVVDYIAPIAGYILSEAVETDWELYNELVISLKDALVKLRATSQENKTTNNDKVIELDQQKVAFQDDLDNLFQLLVGGSYVIKSFDNSVKGQYSITVGESN